MAITLNSLQDKVDDLRVDSTSGTVDVNSEGLRATNAIIDDMMTRHNWEACTNDYTFKLYPRVKRYALPSDYTDLKSIYPEASLFDDYERIEPTVFLRKTRGGGCGESLIAIEQGFLKRMYVHNARNMGTWTMLTSNSSYDGDGTWVATGQASGVRTDGRVYYENGGSVAFDVTAGAGTAILTKTTSSTHDMTDYRYGGLSMDFSFADSYGSISSVTLKIGSDSANYYSMSITTQADGSPFAPGKNEFLFNLEDATVTSSPDIAAIDYIQLTITYTGGTAVADKSLRLSAIYAQNYEDMRMKYYSTSTVYDVSAASRVRRFDGTDATDYLLFPDEASSVIAAGTAWMLSEQQADDTLTDRNKQRYEKLLGAMIDKYPAKTKRPAPPTLSV